MNLRIIKRNKSKVLSGTLLLFSLLAGYAQENSPADSTATTPVSKDSLTLAQSIMQKSAALPADTTTARIMRTKVDGVAAVVGDYVILNSDIDKLLADIENQGGSTQDITTCQLLNLFPNKR